MVARLLERDMAVRLADIVIARDRDGRPVVHVPGVAAHSIDVSISHRAGTAVAVAAVRVGVGIDVTERRFVARDDDDLHRLARRVLTPAECASEWFRQDARGATLAGVCVKEAAGKVLKRSCPGISWHDVVVELAGGVPTTPLLRAFTDDLGVVDVVTGVAWTIGNRVPARALTTLWGERAGMCYALAVGAP